jgi:DNA polymerase-3 subunit delta
MPIISHKDVDGYLKQFPKMLEEGIVPSIFLIYGEEVLYKAVLESILDILVPGEQRSFLYEPFEGINENIIDALRSVNTFALLQGVKVVGLLDSRIFYSKQDTSKLLEKAHAAHNRREYRQAAGALMSLLGMLNASLADLADSAVRSSLNFEQSSVADGGWLDDLIEYCRAKQIAPGGSADAAGALMQAIENGFPQNHYLVITTDVVDKRKRLFKLIQEKGQVIDCSVPRGERQADKAEQEAVLFKQMVDVLKKEQKTMSRPAFAMMKDMTGFDPRTFSNNVAKLVDYVGAREAITPQDVEVLLKRTRQDPIYSFTNALTDADADNALFYMRSLLDNNFHPLQMIAAVANHLRKLIVIREFLDHSPDNLFNASTSFNLFRSNIMPQVKQHDESLKNELAEWRASVSAKKKGKKKAKKNIADVLIAPNPNNPYPVYKLFQKAHGIAGDRMITAMGLLGEADSRLKSSRQPAEDILEWTVIRILNLFKK